METISNERFALRCVLGLMGIGSVGLVVGVFGPSWLHSDSTIAPLAGYLFYAPLGAFVGAIAAAQASAASLDTARFTRRMLVVATCFGLLLFLFIAAQ